MITPTPKRTLLIDLGHLLFRVAAVQKHSNPFDDELSPDDLVGLCMHVAILSIFKLYNKYNPDFLVFAFEGGNNWRKKFTTVNEARRAYKGNRVRDPAMDHLYALIEQFYTTMHSHTSICCLRINEMEADDEIAMYCQLYASADHEIIIISGDKDFIQLLKLPNVKLIDPSTGQPRNQSGDKQYFPDIDYWLFLKCIRGDLGDNVPSAFPRVRETRIKKAYSNEYDLLNFMNEVWRDENDKVHRVGDLFEQNVTLLSLYDQPQEIRDKLAEEVKNQVNAIGKYSHYHFLRFCESFQLTRVSEDAMKLVDMFANNQRFLKGEKKSPPPKLTLAEKVAAAKEKVAAAKAAEAEQVTKKLIGF